MRSPRPIRAPRTPGVLRRRAHVASVLRSYILLRNDGAPGSSPPARLQDPAPRDGRKLPGSRRPPLMLALARIRDNQSRFAVFRIQSSVDSLSTEQLGQVVAALQAAGDPPVEPTHDPRNPHQPDRRAQDSDRDLLVAVDQLLTLTVGAGCEIKGGQRGARVVTQPHVAPPAVIVEVDDLGHLAITAQAAQSHPPQ